MEPSTVIAFPRPDGDPTNAGETALAEIDAAIALVVMRTARRVVLSALPFVETVAGLGLAHAREAGVAFRIERPERLGVATVTIGPLV